jgi:hypothetical protein
VVNTNRGDFKALGNHILTEAERQVFSDWLQERLTFLITRKMYDVNRAIDQINLTSQWALSKATEEQLDDVTEQLLLEMHDLRSVLVSKKAYWVSKS